MRCKNLIQKCEKLVERHEIKGEKKFIFHKFVFSPFFFYNGLILSSNSNLVSGKCLYKVIEMMIRRKRNAESISSIL